MKNGSTMAIKEHLSMKSILKYLMSNGIFIICIFDIFTILYIMHIESHIEYEPLFDNCFSNNPNYQYMYPLNESTYNTMVMTLIINCIIVLWSIFKRAKEHVLLNLTCILIYLNVICLAFSLGLIHIKLTVHTNVISEDNALFRYIMQIFNLQYLQNDITVTWLFITLFIILYIATMYLFVRSIKYMLNVYYYR